VDRHQVVRLPSRLRKPSFQELRLHVFHPPVLSRPHFAQITPEFNEAGIPLRFLLLFPGQNLIDLGQNEQSPSTIELGQHGRVLVSKLVKPTKVFCSGTSNETRFDRVLVPERKPDIREPHGRAVPYCLKHAFSCW
jgi:hypothetical protein